MKYTRKIRLVLLLLTIAFATFGAMTASAGVNFNSTNYITLKKNKKKSAKLKGLTKKQKKKNWKFVSSDTSIVKVKRSGKYGYKLTANKKKDGYTVIRATQSKTAIYLLVKVGKGSTSTNGTTRAWASYGRSAFRQGTSAYNAWNKVVNPNSGGNSGSSGSTGSGSSGSTETTDWYATHPQYTNVLAVYGARDNKMVPTLATSVVGKDQNGYGYDANGIIGTDRNGKKLKAIVPPITFTIETVPWLDKYLKSFDNGYYTGNGGPNYIGKNIVFTNYSYCPSTLGIVKIKTSAPIDDAATKVLHGVKVSVSGSASSGGLGSWAVAGEGSSYSRFGDILGEDPIVCPGGLTIYKLKDGSYFDTVEAGMGSSGTCRYSVTIDGVTKYVDFKIVDHATEFKKWVNYKDNCLTQAQIEDGINRYKSYTHYDYKNYPDNVLELFVRIDNINYLNGWNQPSPIVNGVNYGSNHVRTYKHQNSILFGVPPFIADQTMPNEELGVPGCLLGIGYSYEVGELLKQKYNASPAHWETLEYGGHPHPFLIYGDEYDFNAKNYHLIELTSNWY